MGGINQFLVCLGCFCPFRCIMITPEQVHPVGVLPILQIGVTVEEGAGSKEQSPGTDGESHHRGSPSPVVVVVVDCRKLGGNILQLLVDPLHNLVVGSLRGHQVGCWCVHRVDDTRFERDGTIHLDHQRIVVGNQKTHLVLHLVDILFGQARFRDDSHLFQEDQPGAYSLGQLHPVVGIPCRGGTPVGSGVGIYIPPAEWLPFLWDGDIITHDIETLVFHVTPHGAGY